MNSQGFASFVAGRAAPRTGVDANRTIRSIQCDDHELLRVRNEPGAELGAIDSDLARLIGLWPSLSETTKRTNLDTMRADVGETGTQTCGAAKAE